MIITLITSFASSTCRLWISPQWASGIVAATLFRRLSPVVACFVAFSVDLLVVCRCLISWRWTVSWSPSIATLLWASILSRRRRQCKVGWASFFDPTVEDRLQFFLNAVDGSIPTRVVEHQALHTLLDCWLIRTNQRSRPPGALASGPLASPRGVIIV